MSQYESDIPAGFIDSGERFTGGPVPPLEAQVAAP